jgi:DNA primase
MGDQMSTTRIPDEKLNEIRSAVDIVDIISEYVQLKKQGRNYFGLCPFHGENTPSFSVAPDKQIYYCFGCGAGGNVFNFLMDMEGLSFIEATKVLAEKGNIPLDISLEEPTKTSKLSPSHQKMIEAHELLRKFYHHLLINTKEGEAALEYLLDRGFTEESIEKFQIGYSLNSWDFVYKFLVKRGFQVELMEQAGLLVKNDEGKYFDRFRNRIMFPIFDEKGNTIAFSGRALGEDEPKYLNSPETPIFHKSKILYNFHLARPHIRKKEKAILMEGFADCISASVAGVENTIATMGTSLTDHHISLLKRNTNEVVICYDSDQAGLDAANRASDFLYDAGFEVKVALMPDELDPDEYIKKYGSKSFITDIVGNCLTYVSFKMKYLRLGKNLNNEAERIAYIDAVLKEITKLSSAVEREHYLRQISAEFSISLESLMQQQKKTYFSERKRGNLSRNLGNNQAQSIQLQYEQKLKPAYIVAELRLIAHMLQSKEKALKIKNMLGSNVLNVDDHQAIITYLYGFYEKYDHPDTSLFMNELPDPHLRKIVSEIEMMSINEEATDKELMDYIQFVLKQKKMLIIKEKEAEKAEAERMGDIRKAAAIALEIIQLKK